MRDTRAPIGNTTTMSSTASSSHSILGDERAEARAGIVELLKQAYWMEIETVMSYMANSINPDGVRAQEIIESLKEDIQEELGHAEQFVLVDRRIDRPAEAFGVLHTAPL